MNTVLSYPYFFPTLEWFRIGSLCWDRIYTFRTSAYQLPSDIADLDAACGGILHGVDVRRFSVDPTVKADFAEWLNQNKNRLGTPEAFGRSQFVLLHGLFSSIDEFLQFVEQLKRVGLYQPLTSDRELLPTWEEFEPRLLLPESLVAPDDSGRDAYFRALASGNPRLAAKIRRAYKPKRRGHDITGEIASEVVFVPPEVPLHFLALCATRAAEAENTDLAATARAYADTALFGMRDFVGAASTSVLQAIVPKAIDSIDYQALAEIRQSLALQRLKYQADIQSLCKEIAAVSSKGTLHLAQGKVIDLAKERFLECSNTFRSSRIETVTKAFALTLGAPALATSVASLLGVGLFAPAGVAAAIAAFAAQRLAASSEVSAKTGARGWSYLLQLNRRFAPWRLPWRS